jgi:hypothetical protein
VLIEGCFLVRDSSQLRTNDEVDAAGHRVSIGKGSANDLHLSRKLRHTMVVHAPTSAAALAIFLNSISTSLPALYRGMGVLKALFTSATVALSHEMSI